MTTAISKENSLKVYLEEKKRVNSAPDVLSVAPKKKKKKKSTTHIKNKNSTSNNTNNNNNNNSLQDPDHTLNKSSQNSLNIMKYLTMNNNNNYNRNQSHIHSHHNYQNRYQRDSSASRRESKASDRFLSISRTLSLVSGGERRLSSMEQNREKFESQFCRIKVLLISMQLGLGLSMSALGIYLRSVSVSLEWTDCTHWAGIPLLICGTCGLYFCLGVTEIQRRIKITRIVKISCAVMSLVTAALTLLASITSGSHGKWISDYSSSCDLHFLKLHSPTSERPEKCCIDGNKDNQPISHEHHSPLANDTRCVCKYQPEFNDSLHEIQRYYEGISCRYVFSALKDYFILQSSLMMVAFGVCLWLSIIQTRSLGLFVFCCSTTCSSAPLNCHSNHNLTTTQQPNNQVRNDTPSPNFLRFVPTPYLMKQQHQQHNSNNNNNNNCVPKVFIHDESATNEFSSSILLADNYYEDLPYSPIVVT